MPGPAILIVEDDERIGSTLLRALAGSGFTPIWERDGRGALAAAGDGPPPDLVLLDLGLPDLDGVDLCRELAGRHPEVPILMLTARHDELDVVVGLDAGAVDYITKPFKLAELLARIRAQLRQRELAAVGGGVGVGTDAGGVRVDSRARKAWRDGEEVELRAKEFDLLVRLVADAGRVVSREVLMADVWDEHWAGSTKTLDFHVAALRRKLDGAGKASRITTVRGVGYRFESP
jgi:DNA-binding response OmpR family regulator